MSLQCTSKLSVPKVAVGTQNPVKIQAVSHAIRQVWPKANCIGCEVDSGVSDQPTDENEAILGATNRAIRALRAEMADLGVGLEGYTVDTTHGMFLSAWIAVVCIGDCNADCEFNIGLGSSGRLLLPETLAERIRAGKELGPLMDQVTAQQNTKQKQGAVGILTNGLVDRQEALKLGVLYALARFVSPIGYDEPTHFTEK